MDKKKETNAEIWYPTKELFQEKQYSNDYITFLKSKIGKRILKIRKKYGLTQKDLHKSEPSRISLIENGKDCKREKKKYSSFITDTILSDIVNAINKEIMRKSGNSAEQITRFWIIFGNDMDLCEFLKGMYYHLCMDILSAKHPKYSKQAELIQELFYNDANYSLIYGLARLDSKNINEPPNVKERKALLNAIRNTWNIIYLDVMELFKKSFDHEDFQNKYYLGNSKTLNNQINQWCNEILLPFLQMKEKELKRDSILNIGYRVHNLMEMLYQNKFVNNLVPTHKVDSCYNTTIDKSNDLILSCAKNLTEIQSAYLAELKNYENEKAISKSISELKDYELNGEYNVIGSEEIISYSNSGITFEELLDKAIKNSRRII